MGTVALRAGTVYRGWAQRANGALATLGIEKKEMGVDGGDSCLGLRCGMGLGELTDSRHGRGRSVGLGRLLDSLPRPRARRGAWTANGFSASAKREALGSND